MIFFFSISRKTGQAKWISSILGYAPRRGPSYEYYGLTGYICFERISNRFTKMGNFEKCNFWRTCFEKRPFQKKNYSSCNFIVMNLIKLSFFLLKIRKIRGENGVISNLLIKNGITCSSDIN